MYNKKGISNTIYLYTYDSFNLLMLIYRIPKFFSCKKKTEDYRIEICSICYMFIVQMAYFFNLSIHYVLKIDCEENVI